MKKKVCCENSMGISFCSILFGLSILGIGMIGMLVLLGVV